VLCANLFRTKVKTVRNRVNRFFDLWDPRAGAVVVIVQVHQKLGYGARSSRMHRSSADSQQPQEFSSE
jgi:hypothetical protein